MYKRIITASVATAGTGGYLLSRKNASVDREIDQDSRMIFGVVNVAQCDTQSKNLKNSAFVFIKPHANTAASQALVKKMLTAKGITIKQEGELTAKQIDEGMLIDQHYYAIASKATLLKPTEMPVPKDKFMAEFGISWEEAVKQGLVFNAIDACKYLGVDAAGLDAIWGPCKKVKFGGGFYCGQMEPSIPGKHKKIFVMNGFFMSMRNTFVSPGTSIHYYVVDFEPSKLSWADFRGKVLGPTDPKSAPADSLRGKMLHDWQALGMDYQPNVGENCVHASASPFEGLAEKMNWLKVASDKDPFGAALVSNGVPTSTIAEWSRDPQVKGKSLFDQLEDLDVDDCVVKAVALSK